MFLLGLSAAIVITFWSSVKSNESYLYQYVDTRADTFVLQRLPAYFCHAAQSNRVSSSRVESSQFQSSRVSSSRVESLRVESSRVESIQFE
jgi:hypothetical protein